MKIEPEASHLSRRLPDIEKVRLCALRPVHDLNLAAIDNVATWAMAYEPGIDPSKAPIII
jgi:hypothetical protein